MRTVCGGSAPGGRRWRGSLELEGAGDARRCRLLRAAWAVAGLVALLAVLVAVDAHADRRRQWTTYGSARGRLVVACDMRSDTCSDGRRITTTRATPVPCETSPGVWEMVPADVGCYSVRGLEAWAATTSYLSWGAELDREVWGKIAGATVEAEGAVWRASATSDSSFLVQTTPTLAGETWTASCRIRAGTSTTIRMAAVQAAAGGSTVTRTLSPGWGTYSVTSTATSDGNAGVWLYPTVGGAGDIYVAGCWLTKTSTPGRVCWGGEAPVTCAADRHTISTEGWPTESGEISLVYTPQNADIGSWRYLAATSGPGTNRPSGFYLYRITASGALGFGLRRGDTISAQNTQELAWENGRSYHVHVTWSPERAEIYRDGVLLRSWVPTTVPDSHPGVVYIGTNTAGSETARGSIRALTVRR